MERLRNGKNSVEHFLGLICNWWDEEEVCGKDVVSISYA